MDKKNHILIKMSVTFNLIEDKGVHPNLTVPFFHCKRSELLMDMLSDYFEEDDDDITLSLPNIKYNVMVKIVEFMAITFRAKNDHTYIYIERTNKKIQDILDDDLHNFVIQLKPLDVVELIQAANFLEYTNLLNICLIYFSYSNPDLNAAKDGLTKCIKEDEDKNGSNSHILPKVNMEQTLKSACNGDVEKFMADMQHFTGDSKARK